MCARLYKTQPASTSSTQPVATEALQPRRISQVSHTSGRDSRNTQRGKEGIIRAAAQGIHLVGLFFSHSFFSAGSFDIMRIFPVALLLVHALGK